jgi:TRAP-type C4-dicarboxylate transport system substrate-binding protein
MIKTFASATAAAFLLASSFGSSAGASEVTLRALGWYGNQPQSSEVERPFWKNLESSTGGKLAAQFRTIDEIGLKGFESLRTLQSGAFDVVSFQISFVGGEAPVLMGVDLPGLAFDFDELRKVVDAYRPILERNLESRFKGKLLAAWPYPFQILYCKHDMKGLEDLRGQKVRVSGSLMAEMVKQLGGATVTLAGPEVYQGLMQGIVDCAITGSQYGNSNDWFEVTKSLNVTPVGGAGVVLHVARKDFWDKLTQPQRDALAKSMQELEARLWKMAVETHTDGINCNTGKDPCSAKKGKMTLVETTDADRARIKKILTENVIPLWLGDCTKVAPTCKEDWANTVGRLLGVKM